MRRRDVAGQAFRSIRRQRLRSGLTIFAVMIGAGSVTIMLALVSGAQGFFLHQFESTGQLEQVVVTQATDLSYNEAQGGGRSGPSDGTAAKLNDALATRVASVPHVVGLAKNAELGGTFESITYNGVKLRAEQVQASDTNGIVQHVITVGRDLNASDGVGALLITADYATKWGMSRDSAKNMIGKQVTLTTASFFTGQGATLPDPLVQWNEQRSATPGPPNACCGPGGSGPQQKPTVLTATVIGIVADERGGSLYVPMTWARGLLTERHYQQEQQPQPAPATCCRPGQQPPQAQPPTFTLTTTSRLDRDGYSSFIVKADQATNADAVAAAIRGLGVGAVSAQSFIREQNDLFRTIGLVFGGIGAIALLVAAIGVINTMVMAILERTREIGVLRACGATRRTIRTLFTVEAAMLGFFGGVLGIALGDVLTVIANSVINKQLASSTLKAQNIIGLPIWLIVSVLFATTTIGAVAGLYPAFRAARLEPIDALRYE